MDDGLTWLRLPAELSSLARFTTFAREGARAAGLPDASVAKLDLVLEEVLTNVFRYAYATEPGDAAVGYAIAEGCLRIDVRDNGREFNPLDRQPPDLDVPLADRRVGGLGIFLIHGMAESLAYRRHNGQNVLSIRIR